MTVASSERTTESYEHVYDKLYEGHSKLTSIQMSDVEISIKEDEKASTIIDLAMFEVQSEKAFFNDNHFTYTKSMNSNKNKCIVDASQMIMSKKPVKPNVFKLREQIYPAKKNNQKQKG